MPSSSCGIPHCGVSGALGQGGLCVPGLVSGYTVSHFQRCPTQLADALAGVRAGPRGRELVRMGCPLQIPNARSAAQMQH